MSVAKIIEIKSASKTSVEDAVQKGLSKCAETIKDIQGAWINGVNVVTDATGTITEWRVDLKVTFLVK
ncbi:MAG TPA: dodecin family protein [Xanthomonadaceae bacterium]|nr:dodecin family protein [Xanthomonadaceae bacterium]